MFRPHGPLALRDLIRPYARDRKPDVAMTFLEALENARCLLSLPVNEVSDIVKGYPADLRSRANALLDRLRRQHEKRLSEINDLLPLLESGEAERGRSVFFSEKSQCAVCHRVGSKGGRIGPDLTTIGANRSDHDLHVVNVDGVRKDVRALKKLV